MLEIFFRIDTEKVHLLQYLGKLIFNEFLALGIECYLMCLLAYEVSDTPAIVDDPIGSELFI